MVRDRVLCLREGRGIPLSSFTHYDIRGGCVIFCRRDRPRLLAGLREASVPLGPARALVGRLDECGLRRVERP